VAVVATEDPDGRSQLVAYVVPAPGETVTGRQLRRTLAERLPLAALPGAIVLLDAIPRSTRAKIDRNALPPIPPRPVVPYREPHGRARELAELFEDVLGVERVGLDDDFFDLGGDSLGAVELAAAINERFGTDLPTSMIVETPTVAGLEPRLSRPRRPGSTSIAVHRAAGCTPDRGPTPASWPRPVRPVPAPQHPHGTRIPPDLDAPRAHARHPFSR